MEEEIEELLKENYKNIDIRVTFKNFNLYCIEIFGLNTEANFNMEFDYEYDNYFTKNENINSISEKIDKLILSHFKKYII